MVERNEGWVGLLLHTSSAINYRFEQADRRQAVGHISLIYTPTAAFALVALYIILMQGEMGCSTLPE